MSKKQYQFYHLTGYNFCINCCFDYLKFNNIQFKTRLLSKIDADKTTYHLGFYVSCDMIDEVEELIKETCEKYGVKVE